MSELTHEPPPYGHPPVRARVVKPEPQPMASRIMQSLLDPVVLQRLLCVGGGLIVVGLLVTLASYGIFKNPVVAASTMTAGSLCVIAGGWGLLLKSKSTVAGIALTFLGCVVLPLNLWFYHAQDLIRVDQNLWVGALGCLAVYVATVVTLRRPIFLYAVQLGTILTTLLLLGQLGRWDNLNWLSTTLILAGTATVLAPLAFPIGDNTRFPRSSYGPPLRIGGHVTLAIGLCVLGIVQLIGHQFGLVSDVFKQTTSIANLPWLTTMWLIGSSVYFGCAIVRRRSWFVIPAAVCLFALSTEWLCQLTIDASYKLLLVSGIGMLMTVSSRFTKRYELSETLGHIGMGIIGLCHAGVAIRTIMMLSVSVPLMDRVLPLVVGSISLLAMLPFVTREYRAGVLFAIGVELIEIIVCLMFISQIPVYRKMEIFILGASVLTIGLGTWGQLRETDDQRKVENSILVWFGSFVGGGTLLVWGLMSHFGSNMAGSWDEPLLIVSGMVLTVLGVVLQTKATTINGLAMLGSYIVVIVGSILHEANLAAGLYLGIGGAVIFVGAILLSVFRDRLLRLPELIQQRKGVFQFLNWR